jgi:hypothetical protein
LFSSMRSTAAPVAPTASSWLEAPRTIRGRCSAGRQCSVRRVNVVRACRAASPSREALQRLPGRDRYPGQPEQAEGAPRRMRLSRMSTVYSSNRHSADSSSPANRS